MWRLLATEWFLGRRNETDETDDFRPNELSDRASMGVWMEGECSGFGRSVGKEILDFLASVGEASSLALELESDVDAEVATDAAVDT